jgi:hypothetical protein
MIYFPHENNKRTICDNRALAAKAMSNLSSKVVENCSLQCRIMQKSYLYTKESNDICLSQFIHLRETPLKEYQPTLLYSVTTPIVAVCQIEPFLYS